MKNEIERLKNILSTINPASEDYSTVLANLKSVFWFEKDMKRMDEIAEMKCVNVASAPVITPTEPTPLAESVPAPVVEETETKEVVEEVKEEKPKVKKQEPVTISKETVRTLLSEASKKGIQIQPIIAKFVPEGKTVKFSEIPASSYKDLMEEIKNAG